MGQSPDSNFPAPSIEPSPVKCLSLLTLSELIVLHSLHSLQNFKIHPSRAENQQIIGGKKPQIFPFSPMHDLQFPALPIATAGDI